MQRMATRTVTFDTFQRKKVRTRADAVHGSVPQTHNNTRNHKRHHTFKLLTLLVLNQLNCTSTRGDREKATKTKMPTSINADKSQASYGRIPMTEISSSNHRSISAKEDLSYCIVWSPLPPITWIIPFIGHVGIADSNGVVSDFQGPYSIGDQGQMAFGAPTRALRIRVQDANEALPNNACSSRWDEAIQDANRVYRGRMHNLFCDNCHSHVAYALNSMAVKDYGIEKWDMVKIAMLMFFRARFLSWMAVLQSVGPFCVVLFLILFFKLRLK